MKELYWIDDDVNQINNYAKGIFRKLWGKKDEEGIAVNIIIFGDEYKRGRERKGWDSKAIESLREKIHSSMLEHCHGLEKWNWNGTDGIFKQKEELIQQPPILIDLEDKSIKQLICEWKQVQTLEDFNNNPELDVKALLNKVDIPAEGSVIIDLVLLDGDRTRVLKEGLPIISMKIYEKLKEQGYECILYSAYTYDYPFIEKWKELYNSNKTEDEKVDKIYSGRDMLEKGESDDVVSELKKIAKDK